MQLGVQTVDVARLVVSDVGNDRTRFDSAAVERLAADIRDNGQISPVIVRPAGDQLEIVAGETRTRAIRDILKLSTILVDVRELTDEQAWSVMYSENGYRSDLDVLDEARAMRRRADQYGWSLTETARRFGNRSTDYVSDRWALLELEPDVADLVRTGQLTIRQGASMAGLEPARQRACAVAGSGLTVAAFRRLVSEERAKQDQASLFDLPALTQQEYDAEAGAYVDQIKAEPPGSPVMHPGLGSALVGPTEIADRLQVSRATVSKWRSRHADSFPTPVCWIGAPRKGPKGDAPSDGTPVYFWPDVASWAESTGRAPQVDTATV